MDRFSLIPLEPLLNLRGQSMDPRSIFEINPSWFYLQRTLEIRSHLGCIQPLRIQGDICRIPHTVSLHGLLHTLSPIDRYAQLTLHRLTRLPNALSETVVTYSYVNFTSSVSLETHLLLFLAHSRTFLRQSPRRHHYQAFNEDKNNIVFQW